MSRDYKHMGGKKSGKPGIGTTSFLAFLSGLSIGLLVAFLVYLYQYQARIGIRSDAAAPAAAAAKADGQAGEPPAAVPRPTFDFYKILPSREVNVSEWVAEEKPAAAAPAGEAGGLYILQVGSFKTAEAADQTKARLALLGIEADIQRVVINGQDAVHRVRIGPYQSPEKFEEIRQRLRANQIEFMVLQLKVEDARTGDG
ncbi:MAG: SPOR domain-containing protein [Gammaproteobacteria bacterium]|nr:SPOR domain-containing protein [Gammaproteobacteria bacterium]